MTQKVRARWTIRIVAAVLAAVWLIAGMAIVILALTHRHWLAALLGPPAIWYGLAWVRVALEGRHITWAEARIPWRRP
jgi:hypothetical protein